MASDVCESSANSEIHFSPKLQIGLYVSNIIVQEQLRHVLLTLKLICRALGINLVGLVFLMGLTYFAGLVIFGTYVGCDPVLTGVSFISTPNSFTFKLP